MRSEQTRLSDFSKAIRGSTLKRLKAVPDDQVRWRPADGAMSFVDIGQHLIDADRWLFAKVAEPSLTSMKGASGTVEIESREDYVRLLAELLKSGDGRAAGGCVDTERSRPTVRRQFRVSVGLAVSPLSRGGASYQRRCTGNR